MKIPISEIFESIQWEWRNTWKPSVFVRLWGCNLKCTWCDSKYSWDSTVEKANIMELEEVIKKIKSFKSTNIIFTWWEPTLFQEQIYEIQSWLLKWEKIYTFELETNWSKEIENIIKKPIFDQINISPKLENSWNDEYKIEILNSKWRNRADMKIDLKYVANNLNDLIEIHNNIEYLTFLYDIDKIYIMPLWRTKESQINDIILKFCIDKWYNYCLRQHLILFWDGKWK